MKILIAALFLAGTAGVGRAESPFSPAQRAITK
jgi:hypothetical protein